MRRVQVCLSDMMIMSELTTATRKKGQDRKRTTNRYALVTGCFEEQRVAVPQASRSGGLELLRGSLVD